VKRACELIYTAERQASRDVSLAGLRLKPGSSQVLYYENTKVRKEEVPRTLLLKYKLWARLA
jgi:hypothetical protein